MKKLITSVFILCFICFHAIGQLSFVRVDSVQVIDDSLPLINPWAGGLNFPMFCEMDLNGDGIMDIVAFDPYSSDSYYHLMPFINNGTHGQVDYHYAPQYISHFPLISGFLLSYDYNQDGKMDLFTLSIGGSAPNSSIMVYRNDFNTIDSLNFTLVTNPVLTKYPHPSFPLNIFASHISVPSLVDIDNDGYMDIISWPANLDGELEYQRNVAKDSLWPPDSLRFANATTCWGDFAIQVGTPYNRIDSFGVCGPVAPYTARSMNNSASTDSWNNKNTIAGSFDRGAAARDDTQSVVLVYDNLGNGMKDVLIGGGADNNALYLHNGGTVGKDSMDYQDYNFPSYNVPVNLSTFPYFFFMDVNNDSSKDLISSPHLIDNYRGILYYKNINPPHDSSNFVLQPRMFLQQDMIDVGAGAAPQLFDADADGLPDLLIGDESYYNPADSLYHKGITLYRNIGTQSQPKFQLETRDWQGIDEMNGVGGTLCPTFGDLNGDGAIDMIVGMGNGATETTGSGQLLYFVNTAGAGNPAVFALASVSFSNIHVGNNSAPQLYDLNHDGLLDLIVGNEIGVIKYYQNTGTATVPVFSSTPTKDTLGGIITQVQGSGETIGYASPFFYNDSGTDKLIVGTESGKVYVYDHISGNILGTYNLVDSLINGEEGQRLIPFVGDINHDGHPDMLIGNYSGGVALYMNKDTSLILGTNQTPQLIRPSFNAYPNPASGELYVSFYHCENAHAVLELLNNIGQVIYKAEVTAPLMAISLKGFSSGIYLARFVSNNNTQIEKIIVQKR